MPLVSPVEFKNKKSYVTHACNSSYSGGRSGGIWFEASSRQIVHEILPRKKPAIKRAVGVAQVVFPDFKPQYLKIIIIIKA
jgi:hypothetical protein